MINEALEDKTNPEIQQVEVKRKKILDVGTNKSRLRIYTEFQASPEIIEQFVPRSLFSRCSAYLKRFLPSIKLNVKTTDNLDYKA